MPEDEEEEVTVSDRRHFSLREVSMLSVLILNFAAIIWGAATLTGTVRTLNETVTRLNSTVLTISIDLVQIKIDYNARLRVLEDRNSRQQGDR